MPLFEVGYIRVTHPCAGRHQTLQAMFMLPLDLHVLSLPLAFILSQDQTLHCKNKLFLNLSSNLKGIVWNYSFSRVNKTFLAAQYLQRTLYLVRLFSPLDSFFSSRRFRGESGCKDKNYFLICKTFCNIFQKFFSFICRLKNAANLVSSCLRVQSKYFYSIPPNIFNTFLYH